MRHRPLHHALAAAAASAALLTGAGAAAAASAGDTLLVSGVPLPAGAYGASGSGYDGEPAETVVSQNGRYVVFYSTDDDLAPGTPLDVANIFRKDRVTGAVDLVARTTGAAGTGLEATIRDLSVSNDGNKVAWVSDGAYDPADVDGKQDAYIRDIAAQTTTLATPGTTTDVSGADLSGDGTWLAFTTADVLGGATDANGAADIYRRNLASGTTQLASAIGGTSTAGNAAASGSPSISDDGRWVAFASAASDLVAGFTNGSGAQDVFAHDFTTGATVLVSARFSSSTTGGNGESTRPIIAGTPTTTATLKVAFGSEATDLADNGVTDPAADDSAYVRGMSAVPSVLVSRATGGAGANANSRAHIGGISDDGTRVVFASDASNLGAGDHYYGAYTRNLGTGTTTLLSAKNEYAVNPVLSGDGTFAAWLESGATADADPNLSEIYGRPFPSGTIELVSRPPGGAPLTQAAPDARVDRDGVRSISSDGRYVVFVGYGAGLGTPTGAGIYRRDLRTNDLVLVSRKDGANGDMADDAYSPSMDASGNRVAFSTSQALDPADVNGTTDVYVRDIAAGTTVLASRADGAAGATGNASSTDATLSDDGTRVAFRSIATTFGVPGGQAHAYVRDLTALTTTVADRADGAAGVIGNASVSQPRISGDGRRVLFVSMSTNLSPDDPTSTSDAYLRDLSSGQTLLLSRRPGLAGTKVTGGAYTAAISGDGATVAFVTTDGLAAPEAGPWPAGTAEVVVRTVATGANLLGSRVPGGAPAASDADSPSLSANGSVLAFSSTAPNLLPGLGGVNRDAVFVHDLAAGKLSGPPAFGTLFTAAQDRAGYPSVSGDGQCVAFQARGHNAVTGKAGDFSGMYLYVASGSCPKPEPTPIATPAPTPTPVLAVRPVLTKVSVTNKRFKVGKGSTALSAVGARAAKPKTTPTGTTIAFTLNTKATVRVTILRRGLGRKVGKQCLTATPKRKRLKPCKRYNEVGKLTRTSVPAGAQKLAFSGRLGSKKLPAGAYRATLVASTAAGSSAPVTVSFSIVAR